MKSLSIESLHEYPLKSAKGVNLQGTNILNTGFKNDRLFAIITIENKILTARRNPLLLQINAKINDSILEILIPNKNIKEVSILDLLSVENIATKLFKNDIYAQCIEHSINDDLSDFLGENVRLILVNPDKLRLIKPEYNAQENDVIGFSDVAPIHLINTASLAEINSKLEEKVQIDRFRPNIVVNGKYAFEEENWEYVKIGSCEFEVIIATERCSFLTIDPTSSIRHPKQEPLRTLAKNKRGNKVNFGVYLVPRKLGFISILDKLEVVK